MKATGRPDPPPESGGVSSGIGIVRGCGAGFGNVFGADPCCQTPVTMTGRAASIVTFLNAPGPRHAASA